MSSTPETSPSGRSSSQAENRQSRPVVAAQACEACRGRKTRCDEQRPKCGLCRRLGLDCKYREAQPTKKDKTLEQILSVLQVQDQKIDHLTELVSSDPARSLTRTPYQTRDSTATSLEDKSPHKRLAGAHEIFFWTEIQKMIIEAEIEPVEDLRNILVQGSDWFVRQELKKNPTTLPTDEGMESHEVKASAPSGARRVVFPSLTREVIKQYVDEYFRTYNMIYPLLDFDEFVQRTIPAVLQQGFTDGDVGSVIVLLVLALGKVACEGSSGEPITSNYGLSSGIRGGTAERPPALDIFNEARRRLGFVLSQCSLQNVQALLLTAIYQETHSRHMDFWRTTVMASQAVQVLLKSHVDWNSREGDLLKRAYWTCYVIEGWYYVDLDLPQTRLSDQQYDVALPVFTDMSDDVELSDSTKTKYQFSFLAMVSIQRIIDRINEELQRASNGSRPKTAVPLTTPVIKEFGRQLEEWRAVLPASLQWANDDRTPYYAYHPQTQELRRSNFSAEAEDSSDCLYNSDIINAQLRCRYYYCRFIMYRPFLYKVAHFPDQATEEDLNYCTMCLQSCIHWPVCMSPPKDKKRLIPNMYVWTQSFLGFLLIFRLAAKNEILSEICRTQVGIDKVTESTRLMLEWMKDMRHVDGVAEWSWKMLEQLYSGFGPLNA